MSSPMQDLHALGLNPFAITLLAESMLKSAYVKHCGAEPLTFEFPVRRGDCEGWAGVRITIEAVPAAGATRLDPVPVEQSFDGITGKPYGVPASAPLPMPSPARPTKEQAAGVLASPNDQQEQPR